MFKFKILIKSKSEITGLKKQILLRSALYSFLDRPRKKCTHKCIYRNEHISFKHQTQKSWDGFFFLFFFYIEWYSPLSRNKLFIFSHHGYLSESEESLSFYINAVLHHSLFSLSITIGSRAEICCPVPMPIMTKYCEDKHWHPIITWHNVTGLAMIGGIALT